MCRAALDGIAPERGDNRTDEEIAAEIRFLHARRTADKAKIGANLLEMKARKGHGHFTAWVEAACPFTMKTAQNYMGLAKNEIISFLPDAPTVAYVATARSTPPAAVEEILATQANGETVTVARAQEIKRRHTQPDTDSPLSAVLPETDAEDTEAVMVYRRFIDALCAFLRGDRFSGRRCTRTALRMHTDRYSNPTTVLAVPAHGRGKLARNAHKNSAESRSDQPSLFAQSPRRVCGTVPVAGWVAAPIAIGKGCATRRSAPIHRPGTARLR